MGSTRCFVLSVSLVLSLFLLTTVVDSACLTRSLTVNPSPGGNEKDSVGVFCQYGEERKRLFTAWVDLKSCVFCSCSPSGMRCCTLAMRDASAACQTSV